MFPRPVTNRIFAKAVHLLRPHLSHPALFLGCSVISTSPGVAHSAFFDL
ncbi:unnamed protein product [Amoebophrya sp. A120]|nr:unnamed protein product [Amoebophrya sp. A120]|eukprot:GSA120T00009033001.1